MHRAHFLSNSAGNVGKSFFSDVLFLKRQKHVAASRCGGGERGRLYSYTCRERTRVEEREGLRFPGFLPKINDGHGGGGRRRGKRDFSPGRFREKWTKGISCKHGGETGQIWLCVFDVLSLFPRFFFFLFFPLVFTGDK